MTVKELMEKLSKFNPDTVVLGEFDQDGDQFMVKVDIDEVYEGDGYDDCSDFDLEDEDELFCIIKLDV